MAWQFKALIAFNDTGLFLLARQYNNNKAFVASHSCTFFRYVSYFIVL